MIGRLYLVALVGYVVVKRGALGPNGIEAITRLMIDVIVPCALSVAMIKGFKNGGWEMISPLILFLTLAIALSAALTTLLFRFFPSKDRATDRVTSSLASLPNSFYIPMPIVGGLVPHEYQALAIMLVGGAVLAVNPLQWTVGLWLIMEERKERDWASIFRGFTNGPVIGVISGIILAQFPAVVSAVNGDRDANTLLKMVLGAAGMIGQLAGPMAMVMVGALIASTSVRRTFSPYHFSVICFVRFLLIPGIAFLLIKSGQIPGGPLVNLELIVVAAAPSAMNLAIAARRYGGNWETTSAMLFGVNIVAIIALPIWIAAALSL
ncbi:MAG TPA: AEC family transporter [Candidatus Sumerlaeota bacterium]|nr:AEC family transporter [Candidatus Sumerlaeota bacterium]